MKALQEEDNEPWATTGGAIALWTVLGVLIFILLPVTAWIVRRRQVSKERTVAVPVRPEENAEWSDNTSVVSVSVSDIDHSEQP